MLQAAAYIRQHAHDVPIKIVRKQQGRPDGWDCADAILQDGWAAEQCLAFMREQAENLPDALPRVERTVGAPAPEIIPAASSGTQPTSMTQSENEHYRSLGYNNTDHYFYPYATRQIIRISAPALGKKNYLYSLFIIGSGRLAATGAYIGIWRKTQS
jgi:hypothetical protein